MCQVLFFIQSIMCYHVLDTGYLAGSYLGNVHEVFHGILTTKGHFLKKFNAPFFIEKQV